MSKSLPNYLRIIRKHKNISQQELADAIGLSLRAFSDWETGKSGDIKGQNLVKLISMLGASWEDVSYIVMNNPDINETEELAIKRINNPDDVPSDSVIRDILRMMENDNAFRRAFIAFWSGWSARQ